jgi:hypothetical protein
MEHGRLVRDSAREHYDVEVGTQIIGACNHADSLPEHIRNRFRVLPLEEYSEAEYLDLCAQMLPANVDWITEEAEGRRVAKKVLKITESPDVRNARDIARMSRSLDEIDTLANAIENPDAKDLDPGPLFPGEIKRAQGEVGKLHIKRALREDLVERAGESASEAAEDEAAESDDDAKPAVGAEERAEIERSVEEAAEEAVNDATPT